MPTLQRAAFWFYVKAKGRSGWWTLLAFLNIFGFVGLWVLKDHATESKGALPGLNPAQ